jgi:hypothetical protein
MTMTELPKTTPDLTGLPQEIRESLEAGRIDLNDADIVRMTFEKYGDERGRFILGHFEKLNYVQAYYENRPFGFKIHEFTYHCQLTDPEERRKIAAALKEALKAVEFYSRLEGSR